MIEESAATPGHLLETFVGQCHEGWSAGAVPLGRGVPAVHIAINVAWDDPWS
ncbi:hypothetical protein [Streptomyces sp. DW26H14]|uniref:hypothetical protein n=1 Tax=Streptomyces sp. DW26H14 TaxID=3435395 RepID=UPI00403DF486